MQQDLEDKPGDVLLMKESTRLYMHSCSLADGSQLDDPPSLHGQEKLL